MGQGRFQLGPTDIFEVNIDTSRRSFAQFCQGLGGLVVKGVAEAKLCRQHIHLGIAAGAADHCAAINAGYLADNAAYCTRGCRDKYGFTVFVFAGHQQAAVGSQARHTHDAQESGQRRQVWIYLGHASTIGYGIFAPAKTVGDIVADDKIVIVGFNNLANSAADHDFARGPGHCHATAHIRVNRHVMILDNNFASTSWANLAFHKVKISCHWQADRTRFQMYFSGDHQVFTFCSWKEYFLRQFIKK